MNDGTLISLPASFAGNIDFADLVIRSGNVKDLVGAYQVLGDKICGTELHGADQDISSLASLPVGMPLLWKLPPSCAPEIYIHTWLAEHFDLGIMIDARPGIFGAVKTVTSAGIPVVLSLDGAIDSAELTSVLDYYLHSKYLQVPVEFFHSMFTSRVGRIDVALTDIYPEIPDQILYVDESGNVTGSSRFALEGKFFGRFDGGFTIDLESPLYRFLTNPRKALYFTGSSCCWCENFDLCGGYFRFVDKNFACSPFMTLFKIIKEKAEELANDLSGCDGRDG